MSINDTPWDLRRRGYKDAVRHDKRVRDAIKKNLKELIAEENIISSDGDKLIKIPLKYLDQYRFRHGRFSGGKGVGQGTGNIGDVIAKDGEKDEGSERPGDQPGENIYEAEFSLEELTRLMLEDLALPWLQQKDQKQIVTEKWRADEIRRKGAMSNLEKKRTLKENIKRRAAQHDPHVGKLIEQDLRFRVWEVYPEYHSNAAVYLLMDRSGSMTTEKKYIAKSFFFWLVRFLRLKYRQVDTVFITHDTEAQIVPEKDFFTISNSGGTMCSSAYKLALATMKIAHPKSRWNNYVFHFSDGDNWDEDNPRCKELVTQLLEHVSMMGYGEIRYRDEATFYGSSSGFNPNQSTLLKTLNEIKHECFMTAVIKKRQEVLEALQKFLNKELAQTVSR